MDNNEIRIPISERADGGKYGWRKPARREQAAELAAARATRTAEEQIAILDARLGENQGATKERARLWNEIGSRK